MRGSERARSRDAIPRIRCQAHSAAAAAVVVWVGIGAVGAPGDRRETMRMQGRQWVWLGVHLLAVAAVAVGGALATTANVDGWYAAAAQPAWTPPNWLFGPVWTVLYAGMALAGWLVQRRPGPDRDEPRRGRAVALYWLQLLLNAAWSPVFFAGYPQWGPAALWVAAVIIVVLVVLVGWCAAECWRVDRFAGAVMAVYLLWLLYATTLNIGVAVLNG